MSAHNLKDTASLEQSVNTFCSFYLKEAIGSHIKARELYERFSLFNEQTYSDNALSELFGKKLTSKRTGNGKVYLNVTFNYDLDWTGPAVQGLTSYYTKVQNVLIIDGHNVPSAFRNLKICPVEGKCSPITVQIILGESSIICQSGRSPQDLWLLSACYSSLSIKITGTGMVCVSYEYTTEEMHQPYNTFESKATVDGIEYICRMNKGKAEIKQSNVACQTEVLRRQLTKRTRLPDICGYVGYRHDDPEQSAMLTLVDARADYVVEQTVLHSYSFAYIMEEDTQGSVMYRCYHEYAVPRHADFFRFLKLHQSPLPESCLTIKCSYGDRSQYVNMMAALYKEHHITICTSFLLPELPDDNLLDKVNLYVEYILLDTPLHRFAAKAPQTANLSEFLALATREAGVQP